MRRGREPVALGARRGDLVGERVVAEALPRVDALELRRAVGLERRARTARRPARPRRRSPAMPSRAERVRELAAGVRLLDAAGQRALRADRQPPAVGRRRPAEDAGREDELVLRAERRPPSAAPPRTRSRRSARGRRSPPSVLGQRLPLTAECRHVDSQRSPMANRSFQRSPAGMYGTAQHMLVTRTSP